MVTNETESKLAIQDVLCRFFQSFDDTDWTAMRSCLCDDVFVDYSSFRDVPPALISGDRYVEQRRAALGHLDMQHNFLNLHTTITGTDTAKARCNYLIHRFHPVHDGSAPRYFHSCGHYDFGLRKTSEGWRLSSIVQVLLRNWGDPEIHGATRSADNTRHV